MMRASLPVAATVWRVDGARPGEREVAEEAPVAITYNRVTHAVMMATPADLEDFAFGFSLSEGIVETAAELEELAVVEAPGGGVELRCWVPPARMAALARRRRRLAGATGCGMCGLESLAEAMRPVPRVGGGGALTAVEVRTACASLAAGQALNRTTRAVHAAGFWRAGSGLVSVREDVGRHNAVDKLGGALARAGVAAEEGVLLLTSRVSIELVQKAARMGARMVAAVSAPTGLAIREAAAAGITLIGVARADGFEVFTHAERVSG